MSLCADPHPSLPVKCVAPERNPNHDKHFAMHEGEPVEWDNHRYVNSTEGIDPDRKDFVKQRVVETAAWVRNSNELRTEAVARASDPETSWDAARAQGDLRDSQAEVYALFQEHGDMSDRDVELGFREMGFDESQKPESGLRARRAELVQAGLLEFTGRFGIRDDTGSRVRIWGLPKTEPSSSSTLINVE